MSNRVPQHVMDEWVQRARDADILEEALARGAKLKKTSTYEHTGPCPVCGGTDRFSVHTGKRIFNCRGSKGGDVIALVMHIEGLRFLEAVAEITGDAMPGAAHGVDVDAAKERTRQRREEAERRREEQERINRENERRNRSRAGDIWRAAVSLDNSPAEAYLLNRGIPKPPEGWPECFRFHPRVAYPQQSDPHPALIARADNERGIPVAIWRIYLTRDGQKLAVPNSKLGLGPVAGAAVRIGGVSTDIGVAEGIESALGAWSLLRRSIPVWAALSTSGLSGLVPPAHVKRITIFPDGDKPIRRKGDVYIPSEPAGRLAAAKLRARMVASGRVCIVTTEPAAGKDYLDLWNEAKGTAA